MGLNDKKSTEARSRFPTQFCFSLAQRRHEYNDTWCQLSIDRAGLEK